MTDGNGLDAGIARELRAAGREQDEPKVAGAVQAIAASHAGRPLDEVESVLRESIRDVTGDRELVSPGTLTAAARRISESAPHA